MEELRIQRQIAETNQAIAAAKLATVTAEKDISDLLTRPAPGTMTVNTYGNVPGKTSAEILPPGEEGAATIPVIVPKQQEVPYSLVSISMSLNKWNAIVALQGQMFSVGVGDILPPDESVVTHISKNSITLRKDGKSRRIGITASL